MGSYSDPSVMSLCGKIAGAYFQGHELFKARDFDDFAKEYEYFWWNVGTERERLFNWLNAWGIFDLKGDFQKLFPTDRGYKYALTTLANIASLFADLKTLDSTYGISADKSMQLRITSGDSPHVTEPRKRHRIAERVEVFFKRRKQPSSSNEADSLVRPLRTSTSTSTSSSNSIITIPRVPEGTPNTSNEITAFLRQNAGAGMEDLFPNFDGTIEKRRNELSEKISTLHRIHPQRKKIQWAVSDKEKSERIVQELKRYTDGLYHVLPPPKKKVSTAGNRHFNIPFSSSPMFTGRSEILEKMHQHLCEASSDTTRQRRFVLLGEGGSGKTEIAVKFAEGHRDFFWNILWIDATSQETAKKSFRDIAQLAEVDGDIDAVKQWLTKREEDWLLIIDKADDLSLDVSEYFPAGSRGRILVTSQNLECWNHAPDAHYDIKGLEKDDAISLLFETSKSTRNEKNREYAEKIVGELGTLAGEVVKAGEFIANRCEIGDFLKNLNSHPDEFRLRKPVQGCGSPK